MIEVHDIRKTYPDGTVALAGVDLAFGDGMLGLLGPNGAGKTTLLSILALAQEPSAGERTYFGVPDGRGERSRIRRMIGYLPQDFVSVSALTGLEYLMMCGELRGVPLKRRDLERRVWALLEAVELTHAARRRSGDYSGGMLRRLGLAQALIHSPRFLVVDEPTAGLDPEERIRFRDLITDLAEEIPVLLSTHIVEDIEATCPRLGVIAHGRLLFDGEPGEIMAASRDRLWLLPAPKESDSVPVPAGALKIGQRAGQGNEAFQVLWSDAAVADGEPPEPTLEEAYAAFLARSGEPPPAEELPTTEVAAA